MAADGNLLETPNGPQLPSVQLLHLCYLLLPFQGRAPWKSNPALFPMGSVAIPAWLSLEQRAPAPGGQLSPGTVVGSNQIPELHKRPRDKGQGQRHGGGSATTSEQNQVSDAEGSRASPFPGQVLPMLALRPTQVSEAPLIARARLCVPVSLRHRRGQPGELCHPGALHRPISASHGDAARRKGGRGGKGPLCPHCN